MKTKLILGSLLALTSMTNAQNNYIPGLSPTAGNIGINLPSAPTEYNLQVRGSIGMAYGSIFGVTNTGWAASQTKIFQTGWDATNSDYLTFFTPGNGGATNAAEKMRITNSGKIGIGVVNPGAKLHVNYDTNPAGNDQWGTRSIITQVSSIGAGSNLKFAGLEGNASTNYTGESLMYGVAGTAANGLINYGGNFAASGGNQAFGYPNYGVYAQATGNANCYGIYATASGGSTSNWAGMFNGNVSCVSLTQTSDKKLKNDIKPLADATSKIKMLKPSTYTYKTTEFKDMNLPAGKQMGLIAQELEEVFPELVLEVKERKGTNDKGETTILTPDYKTVNYVGLIPVLIAGIQEQQKTIESQQKQLDEQKAMIDQLSQKASNATGINSINAVETGFQMSQNEPNPFTHETVVKYTLPQTISNAFMAVYDLTGKQITTFPINEKGSSSITITSEKLAAGIYIYSIVADGKVMDSKRMIVAEK